MTRTPITSGLILYPSSKRLVAILWSSPTLKRSGARPLSTFSPPLFRELSPEDDLHDPLPEDTMMGHVHLYGSNLEDLMRFYRDVLGFKEGVIVPGFRFADVELDRPHVIAFNA